MVFPPQVKSRLLSLVVAERQSTAGRACRPADQDKKIAIICQCRFLANKSLA